MKQSFSALMVAAILSLSVRALADEPTPLWRTMPDPAPMPHADQSAVVPLNGIELYYAIFNKRGGNPVILLHGGLGSSDQWGDEVPLLSRNHEVIVVDSRGHGRSTLGSIPLTYTWMESDVLAVMDLLKIDKASIVGWSDGGIIGLLLAIDHPDRIDKLFAYGANFNDSVGKPQPPDPAAFARYKAGAEATYRRLSPTPDRFPELLAALRQLYSREPNISPAALGAIRAPTVIADGQYEQFISREHTETLAGFIHGAQVVIIPNVSHGGPLQDPVSFHRAVTSLLDGSRE